jgi:hypothetical protein
MKNNDFIDSTKRNPCPLAPYSVKAMVNELGIHLL